MENEEKDLDSLRMDHETLGKLIEEREVDEETIPNNSLILCQHCNFLWTTRPNTRRKSTLQSKHLLPNRCNNCHKQNTAILIPRTIIDGYVATLKRSD